MIEARLLTGIPMADDQAILRAPVRWDLGAEEGRIRMAVPLFSLHRYTVWARSVSALRLQSGHHPELTMLQWLRLTESEPGAAATLEDALTEFRAEWGIWPTSLVDPLIAVSDPVDPEEAWRVVLDWSASVGLPWTRQAESVDRLRAYLADYCSHVMDPSSLVLVITQMQQVMVQIKKKLLADDPATIADDRSPWQKQRRRLQQRRARASTAS